MAGLLHYDAYTMNSAMKICVIIPAAGSSSRYLASGATRHKLDEDLAGREVLIRSIELFANREDVSSIVIAGPHDEDDHQAFRERYGHKLGFYGVTLCKGGKDHRYESVLSALNEVPNDATHIAVHDAARPCASAQLIDRIFEAAPRFDAVIPAVPVSDTIKRIEDAPEAVDEDPLDSILGSGGKANQSFSRIVKTLDRAGLVAVQTPQVFAKEVLVRAYAQPDLASTDDSGLVEKLGVEIMVAAGESRNIKITTAADLELARALFELGGQSRQSHKRF
jgi:2-C-methyl-D-erythritol 4-phosphate cytidylyltransferase